jgi:hypothetical protein
MKETRTMLQKMQADILFLDPAEAKPGIAVLIQHGFEIEPLTDWVDEAGPTVFFRIRINTEIDEDHFMDFVQDLVDRYGGDCIEAGLADPPSQAA